MKFLAVLGACLLLCLLACSSTSQAEAASDQSCKGSPANAVLKLPPPLSEWGALVCTPYGHIISNHDGWYWSKPGGYSPVFIPSQMVRNNPKAIGNSSFFTKIDLSEVPLDSQEAQQALLEIQKGYSPETPKAAYRLYVEGSLGRHLVLYFFDWGKSLNGIWCGEDGTKCESSTSFMLLSPELGS